MQPKPPAAEPAGDEPRPRPRIVENRINGGVRKGEAPPAREGDRPGALPGSLPDGMRRGEVPIEKLIEVAEDIEPGWAKSLRERLETDRDATIRAIRQNAGRLVGLAMLKERNRGIYEMKVKELQAQIEARKIAQQYHEAQDAGREDDCNRALERMREACQRVIDLQLWQRASELNSLEVLVKEQRESLERDAKPDGLRTLVAALVAEMTAARPALGLFDVIERRPHRPSQQPSAQPDLQPVVRASDAVPPPPPPEPSVAEPRRAERPGEGPPPGAGHPDGRPDGRPGGRGEGRGRELPVERFVEVTEDISPAAAAELREQIARDREGTIRSIRQGGPRFFGLVVMKDRDPELYQLKVKELKLHLDLRDDAIAYHDAQRDNLAGAADQALARMNARAGDIVHLQLQQRGREVTSLAAMIDEERAALTRDSRPEATVERRERMVDDLMHAPPAPGLSDLIERRGRRHERESIPSATEPPDAPPASGSDEAAGTAPRTTSRSSSHSRLG